MTSTKRRAPPEDAIKIEGASKAPIVFFDDVPAIGSGGGIRQLSEGTVDFGASDAPMSDAELAQAKGPVLHFPTVIGAVVITYNLPGITQPLKLTGDVVAEIYQGRITKWNDSRIAAINPSLTLPASDVLVVHSSDGSGTTYIFSDYLSSVSPSWLRAMRSLIYQYHDMSRSMCRLRSR